MQLFFFDLPSRFVFSLHCFYFSKPDNTEGMLLKVGWKIRLFALMEPEGSVIVELKIGFEGFEMNDLSLLCSRQF